LEWNPVEPAQQDVAGFERAAIDDLVFVDHADAEAGQVVLALGVEAGQLGGFAADEGAAGLLAAVGDARDDLLGDADFQVAGGEVVEEEQGLGAAHDQVVGVHGHQVDAHGVVLVQHERELELGAHAVGARHQQRVLVALGQAAQAGEAAQVGQHLGAHGALDVALDALDQGVARVDVDTGVAVGKTLLWLVRIARHGSLLPPSGWRPRFGCRRRRDVRLDTRLARCRGAGVHRGSEWSAMYHRYRT
jgi:hypothetical protein